MDHDLERTLALPLWMRDPQWRWKLALLLRADTSASIIPFRSDSSLYEAAGFFRSLCRQPLEHAYRKRHYPEMILAYAIWNGVSMMAPTRGGGGRGNWRGIIEAMILSGVEPADFSPALGVDLPADSVTLYRDVFFDVTSYLNSEPAIHVNVLGTSEQELHDRIGTHGNMEHNCLLKLFAYSWGPDALLSYFFSKSRGQNMAHTRWLRMLAGEILTRQTVRDALNSRSLYKKECLEIFKVALKNWEMPPESLSTVEDDIRRRFLHETVQLLSDTLSRADKFRAMDGMRRDEALKAATAVGFLHV